MNLNIRLLVHRISILFVILGAAMIPSVLVSLYFREQMVAKVFAGILIPLVFVGFLLNRYSRPVSARLRTREGFVLMAACWLAASFLGAFPYVFAGIFPSFIDAFFESASSFTTTGATLVPDIEMVPKGIIFWRSFSQWLGGLGILVFAISLLPSFGISGYQLSGSDSQGSTQVKVNPRMVDSAKLLYLVYGSMTLAAIFLLLLGGLDLFDSSIIAFGSLSSGGMMNYNDGAAHYNSSYIELLIAFFTIMACINFSLYLGLIRGNIRSVLRDSELRSYLCLLGGGILLITWNLWQSSGVSSPLEAFRLAVFHTASFATTTGVYTADYNMWPTFSKSILFLLMFVGVSSASTGGGIKVIRIIVLVKLVLRGLLVRMHPRAVMPIKIGNKAVNSDNMARVMSFLYLYLFVYLFSVFILSFENLDLVTTFSATGAILNNIGAGFELVGPAGTFSIFSPFSKIYLSLLMIAGRLELFTILLLFMPSFWNPDR